MACKEEKSNCVACSRPLLLAIENAPSDGPGEQFCVYRCPSCGTGATWPVPDDLSPYYETYYGKRHGFTARYRARRRLSRVRKYVPGGKLLDIGYGEGTFVELATIQGFDCVGVERFADERVRPFATFRELRDINDSFDAITMWHSLEHLAVPDVTIGEITELLTDDGSLFIAVPNFASTQAKLFTKDWLHVDVPRHLFHFTPSGIEKLLKKHGLSIAETWYHESEYDIMGWSQSTMNKLFRERNRFFSILTGKDKGVGAMSKFAHLIVGSAFSALAVPLVLADILFKRGGTIVVRAVK